MRIIEKNQSIDWLSANGVSVSENIPSFRGFTKIFDSHIPVDSGRKTSISRALASQFDTDGESLLWIHEFGIWPSSEDGNLFERFRRSLGENRSLKERPGHIFTRSDLTDVASLLAMVLYFVWGAILFCPANDLAVKISHNEYTSIFTRNKEHGYKVIGELTKYFAEKKR
ncbi:MAG TPA: hypothetical protein VGA73_13430 [Candidatus Binatia bacterium]